MNFRELLLAQQARKANAETQPTQTTKTFASNSSIQSALASLAASRSKGNADSVSQELSKSSDSVSETLERVEEFTTTDKHGNIITYNAKQKEFIDLVLSGKSCILIGAAGTGKTTTMKGVMSELIRLGIATPLGNHSHKYLPQNAPGITVSAYTRRATNNIRKNLSEDMQGNAITIHKLLEYQPEYETAFNEETGKEKTTMRFLPSRNSTNPLPSTIKVCAIEEASMVSTDLFAEVDDAYNHNVQYIFLGDIQQLPPVFGSAILGYKMLELPVVELTEVYRQALESPIIRLAHRILSGVVINEQRNTKAFELNQANTKTWENWIKFHPEDMGFEDWKEEGKMTLHAWKKKISPDAAVMTLAKFFLQMLSQDKYNPESDAILIPFNKSCGTDELNKHIAGAIAKRDQKLVWEVVHGFRKSYYSIGDKCLYDREDAIVTNIYPNTEYTGASAQSESASLNYWGHKAKDESDDEPKSDDIDFLLTTVSAASGDDDRVRAASHIIELTLLDSDRTVRIKDAGQFNNLILGYAITVHKSQGSEWDKVFLCLHNSHNTMLSRELLYTAVTRPKKELFVICEPDTFVKGIENQRIKGNTLAEKAEYFKGKLENGDLQSRN